MKPGESTAIIHSLATNTPDVGQRIPLSPHPSIGMDRSPSPPIIHPEAAFIILNNKTQPSEKPSPMSLPSVLMSKDLSSFFSPKLQKTTHSQILPDMGFATLNSFSISKQITSFMIEESKALDSNLPSKSFCNDAQYLSLSGPSVSEALPPQPSAEHSQLSSLDTVTLHRSDFLVGQCLIKGAEISACKNTNLGLVPHPAPSASLGLHPPSSSATDSSSHSSETNCEDAIFSGSEKVPVTEADHESTLSESSDNEDRLPAILLSLKVPCQLALSCNSHNQQDTLIDSVDAKLSNTAKPSQQQEAEPPQNDIKILAPAPPIQNCTFLNVDNIQQRNMNQAMVNGDSVYMSDMDSSGYTSKEAFVQTETDQRSTIHTVSDDHSSLTELEKLQELRQSGAMSKQNKFIRYFDACEQQVGHKTEVQPHRLMTESFSGVQETSVDVSDGENEDADFFQQLNAESKVYWAEPAQITILAEEFNTFQDSDALVSSEDTVSLSILSSSTISGHDETSGQGGMHSDPYLSMPNSCSSLCAATEKSSNPSVSGQTAPSLSSHIVHRKDVPLLTESKHTHFPSPLTLDTSTPLRALQSWKNLQSQRNALTCKLSQRDLYALSSGESQTPTRGSHRPSPVFSSTTFFPLLCTDLTLDNSTPVILRNDGATEDKNSKTVDWIKTPGPGSDDDKQQEEHRNETKSQDKLDKKANLQCCCSCHRPQNCCSRQYFHPQHVSVSNAALHSHFFITWKQTNSLFAFS